MSIPPPDLSRPLRLVFMGTPDFAVPSLQALFHSEDEVVGVVAQPDKPSGRRMLLHAPPVKKCASAHQVPVFQPQKIRSSETLAHLRDWQPDLIVVAAYGRILPRPILDLPPHGCINVHASLLPKYRGAAPIQWAIARGETHSGVTIMKISEKMDAGDILLQTQVELADNENGGSLHDTLAILGAQALVEALALFKQGKLSASPQNEETVTYAPMLKKEDGRIDWAQDAVSIEQRIRAFHPWPSAYTYLAGKRLKILGARVDKENVFVPSVSAASGSVIGIAAVHLSIATGATGKGCLNVHTVQLEGKKPLPISEFLKGRNIVLGLRLGT